MDKEIGDAEKKKKTIAEQVTTDHLSGWELVTDNRDLFRKLSSFFFLA